MDEVRAQRAMRGRISKRAGEFFEQLIELSLRWYEENGIACIEKTPEPMKPLRPVNNRGHFLACYVKAGQPDFKGTLLGGRSVVFEAKHTDSDRIEYSRLTKEQQDRLALHSDLGAIAFVLVSFGLQNFYRVPWGVWANMKGIYGRKHIKEHELEQYRVPFKGVQIDMLDGLVQKKESGSAGEKKGAKVAYIRADECRKIEERSEGK